MELFDLELIELNFRKPKTKVSDALKFLPTMGNFKVGQKVMWSDRREHDHDREVTIMDIILGGAFYTSEEYGRRTMIHNSKLRDL